MESKEEAVKTTLRLPPELSKRLRVALAYDGRSFQEIMVGMVEHWVSRKEEEMKP